MAGQHGVSVSPMDEQQQIWRPVWIENVTMKTWRWRINQKESWSLIQRENNLYALQRKLEIKRKHDKRAALKECERWWDGGRGQLPTINQPLLCDILNLHLAWDWMEPLRWVGCQTEKGEGIVREEQTSVTVWVPRVIGSFVGRTALSHYHPTVSKKRVNGLQFSTFHSSFSYLPVPFLFFSLHCSLWSVWGYTLMIWL